MLGIEASTVPVTVLWVCVGGTLLSVLFLWLEFHSGQRLSRPLSLIFAILFLVVGVVFLILGRAPDAFLPFLLLATMFLGVRATHSERARQFAKRHAKPKLIWGLLLLLSGVATGYFALHINSPSTEIDLPGISGTVLYNIPDIKALTDLGREIELFHFDDMDELGELERQTLAADLFAHQIIRLGKPDEICNCHGWVFTGGQYGVHSVAVDDILVDNGYVEVSDVQAGDVVIYRTDDGEIQHTGLVRLTGADGLILVESKWGMLGVYIHPPEATPWGSNFLFYRSSRKGHVLQLPPVSPTVIRTAIASTNGERGAFRVPSTEKNIDRSICRGASLRQSRHPASPGNRRLNPVLQPSRHRFVAGGNMVERGK
jgi:hypothetical protein